MLTDHYKITIFTSVLCSLIQAEPTAPVSDLIDRAKRLADSAIEIIQRRDWQ